MPQPEWIKTGSENAKSQGNFLDKIGQVRRGYITIQIIFGLPHQQNTFAPRSV